MLFRSTDNVTGSTFVKGANETVAEALQRKRDQFAQSKPAEVKPEAPKEPANIIGKIENIDTGKGVRPHEEMVRFADKALKDGIVSQKEHDDFIRIDKELGDSKIKFAIDYLRNTKNKAQAEDLIIRNEGVLQLAKYKKQIEIEDKILADTKNIFESKEPVINKAKIAQDIFTINGH